MNWNKTANGFSKNTKLGERYRITIFPVNVIEGKGTDVAEKILEIAKKENVDVIVVGRTGKYVSSENFLIGSSLPILLTTGDIAS